MTEIHLKEILINIQIQVAKRGQNESTKKSNEWMRKVNC